jgi:tetratricopeptide (TPR) repeat protein
MGEKKLCPHIFTGCLSVKGDLVMRITNCTVRIPQLCRAAALFGSLLWWFPDSLLASETKLASEAVERGNEFLNDGQVDKAITAYSDAIRLDPKSTDAYYGRGNAYKRKNDLDKAIADFAEVIRLDPSCANGYWGRGCAYSDKGDCNRAITEFTDAIRLNPKIAEVYHDRGMHI